jgi:hypothetical protein
LGLREGCLDVAAGVIRGWGVAALGVEVAVTPPLVLAATVTLEFKNAVYTKPFPSPRTFRIPSLTLSETSS